ncbi:MAG: hypothetical protein NT025_04820 [bacterium]|nr:hypothetical protein [bacterium]
MKTYVAWLIMISIPVICLSAEELQTAASNGFLQGVTFSVSVGLPIPISENDLEYYSGVGNSIDIETSRPLSKWFAIYANVVSSGFTFNETAFRKHWPWVSNKPVSPGDTRITTYVLGVRAFPKVALFAFAPLVNGGIGYMDGDIGQVHWQDFEGLTPAMSATGMVAEFGIGATRRVYRRVGIIVKVSSYYQVSGATYESTPLSYLVIRTGIGFKF